MDMDNMDPETKAQLVQAGGDYIRDRLKEAASGWWWLSYAGDDGFRGVIISGPTTGFLGAMAKVTGAELSPGGQVRGWTVPDEMLALVPEDMRNRLLSKDEAESLNELFEKESDGG
jgi:hypothetical protein